MDTEYEMVVDAEVGLLVFLLLHGIGLLVNGEEISASLARRGALSAETLGLRVRDEGLPAPQDQETLELRGKIASPC